MDGKRLLETFLELVRIDSPSYHEAQVAGYLVEALADLGCSVFIDDASEATGSDTGNVIAMLPGTVPGKLYFSAHMDTVNPGEGIEPVVVDGIVSSAGETILGADDKAGVAAIIELVRTLAENDRPHPDIGILFSVCEEVGLLGARAVDGSSFAGEPVFVLDADGLPGSPIIGSPYCEGYTITFKGRAAHAGAAPEDGASAIVATGKALVALPQGRLDERTTANIGTIQGGVASNVVPDTAVIKGEFRTPSLQKVDELRDTIELAASQAVEGSEVSFDLEWSRGFDGYDYTVDSPIVQTILNEGKILGLTQIPKANGGGTDANVYIGKGLQPIVLAIGMTDVHSARESLAVKDLEALTRLLISITYRWNSLPGTPPLHK